MLRTDITWPETFRYQTNSDWEPAGFFSEALCQARSFDLMLGFFSSAAINVLAYGFASFICNGGKMRMIINDLLGAGDIEAIARAHGEGRLPCFDTANPEEMSRTLNKRDRHFFDCLAWLIRHGRIDLRIVRMLNGTGIAHTKCGTFGDGNNRIGFEGSLNFSLSALLHNKESLGVYCDWNGAADTARINSIQESFERTFNGLDADFEFVDAASLKSRILDTAADKDLAALLRDELELWQGTDFQAMPASVKKALQKAKERIKKDIEKMKERQCRDLQPRFPFATGPRDYQQEAFDNWKANRQRGFFAMATGTGKTVTALNCLLEIYNRCGYYKAIIVVPTLVLVDQWAAECRKFNFNNIVKVSSQSPQWREELATIKVLEELPDAKPGADYVIIVTYASLTKPDVCGSLFSLPKGKVLLIADEAHNMGSPQMRSLLDRIPWLRRIGLSATPRRQFDREGNGCIAGFFGFEGEDYTYSYPMRLALDNGVLCPYFYYPHLVRLTDTELEEYLQLSTQIGKYLNINGNDFKDDPVLTALLIKRKRIVHKAVNKQVVFKEILTECFDRRQSLAYTLVYVPEGSGSDLEDDGAERDGSDNDGEDNRLINLYTSIVRDIDPTVTVAQYTSRSQNRDELLAAYASGQLNVLTSMKCLDEGVDVPRSELAVFCASTGNPRQFIQRRGRILRPHKDKPYAVIHDLVVAPMAAPRSDAFAAERNLLRTELKRVRDFASLSQNPTAALMELSEVMAHYNLNLYKDDEPKRPDAPARPL